MMKNTSMRVASGLLGLTLATSCFVGGTFAKYITGASANDMARVAKWGVVVTAGGHLFSDTYKIADDNKPTTTLVPADNTITVNAKNATATTTDRNVVAPGTKSAADGLTIAFAGEPEVAYKITGEIKAQDIFLDLTKGYAVMTQFSPDKGEAEDDAFNKLVSAADKNVLYKKNGTSYTKVTAVADDKVQTDLSSYYIMTDVLAKGTGTYYPVQYTMDVTGSSYAKQEDTTANAIAKYLLEGLAKGSGSTDVNATVTTDKQISTYTIDTDDVTAYNPNFDLAKQIGTFNITWDWEYYVNDTTDAQDTILGNMMTMGADGKINQNDVTTQGSIQSASATSYVVFSTDNVSYADVTLADNVVSGGGAELACLNTQLDIKLTVTQVD